MEAWAVEAWAVGVEAPCAYEVPWLREACPVSSAVKEDGGAS